jgi:hypothetical protein
VRWREERMSDITCYCALCEQKARRIEELEAAIKAFAKDQGWATPSWKAQSHIKPLFDIARELEERKDE